MNKKEMLQKIDSLMSQLRSLNHDAAFAKGHNLKDLNKQVRKKEREISRTMREYYKKS